jgi:hypothetical protein
MNRLGTRAKGVLFVVFAIVDAPAAPVFADASAPMSMPEGMMMGALGSYGMTREASGTSWQPDSSMHGGVHIMEGNWMFMGHALLNGVYDRQRCPRGDTSTFFSGMLMGMALGLTATLGKKDPQLTVREILPGEVQFKHPHRDKTLRRGIDLARDWAGGGRRGWYAAGPHGHYRGCYAGPRDPSSSFDEWHQRAHERMKESSPADDPGRG